MSQSPLRKDVRRWRSELEDFIASTAITIPAKNQLTPLQNWQRRVTGGVLAQFLQFLQKPENLERFPQLDEFPLEERLFLFISDEAGLHATKGLIDPDSEQVLSLLKEQWRAFLEADETSDDEDFRRHYEFWSAWHTNLPDHWDVEALDENQSYWVHEEGFVLADGAGRGAQHLWRWDGDELILVEEMATSWVS